MALLDDAPLLCAFNGVRFDLPFLARRWGVPDAKVGSWVRKMVDPFEGCKLALGQTFSLNRLLEENGLPVKTGSGLEAVRMAKEARWAELAEYCMHDTRMTHAVAALGHAPGDRSSRIMVTMASDAAEDPSLLHDLLAEGSVISELF